MSEAVNGLAIYCGIVRRLPGVGAASPDEKHFWCRLCAVLQMHILSGYFVTRANRLWPKTCTVRCFIQDHQMTSLYGVSPIPHRIKKYSYGVYGA